MRRKLFTLASLLSLVLCAATAGLWVYCSLGRTSMRHSWHGARRHMDVRLGDDIFVHISVQSKTPVVSHVTLRHLELPGLWYDHELLSNRPAGSVDWYIVDVKQWMACAALALLPVTHGGITLTRRLRRPPPHPFTCARCGYNLTGNTSGVCPECGMAIAEGGGAGMRRLPDENS